MKPIIKTFNIVVDCSNPTLLADFYSKLLRWEITLTYTNGWTTITSPEGIKIVFQEVEGYIPPVWPQEEGKQGQMLHMDFIVENLEQATLHAIECGAKIADTQYFKTSMTMFDPEGHPFCLETNENE